MSEDEQQGAEDQPAADAGASIGSGQNGEERRPARKRVIEVGWLIDGGGPSFLWQTPKSLHQAKKPPDGKNPWFDRFDDGSIAVRAAYTREKGGRHDDQYVHYYRTRPLASFAVTLGLLPS